MKSDSDSDEPDNTHERTSRLLHLLDEPAAEEKQSRRPRRRVIDPSSKPSEFGTQPSQSGLTVADLLGATTAPDASRAQLEKRLARLSRAEQISAPLPVAVQARANRVVGYANASAAMSDWDSAVQKQRHVETLVFPLNEPRRERASLSGLAGQATETELEREIQAALAASGLASDKDVVSKEQSLLAQQADPVQAERRQKELAKLRALALYEEEKNKRVRRIKSKKFRKLRKKRAEREQAAGQEADQEAQALARAEERMSLRHKNTSTHMRALRRNRDGAGLAEANAVRLTALAGREDSEGEPEDEARALVDEIEAGEDDLPAQGVFAMQFMKRAHEEAKSRARDEAKALLESLTGAKRDNGGLKVVVGGRRVFGESDGEEEQGGLQQDKTKKEQSMQQQQHRARHGHKLFEEEDEEEEEGGDDADEGPANPTDLAATTIGEANSEPPPNLPLDNPWLAPQRPQRALRVAPLPVAQALDALPVTAIDEANQALVRRAFADAGVVAAEFETERGQSQDEEQEAEDQELPGWGSWAGAGASKPKKKEKKVPATKLAKQANVPGLKHVVVSERAVKAVAKYCVDRVPYPFTSPEQYARALALPLGPEWNTQTVHTKLTQPRTVVKAGKIIDPVSWPQDKSRSFERPDKRARKGL